MARHGNSAQVVDVFDVLLKLAWLTALSCFLSALVQLQSRVFDGPEETHANAEKIADIRRVSFEGPHNCSCPFSFFSNHEKGATLATDKPVLVVSSGKITSVRDDFTARVQAPY